MATCKLYRGTVPQIIPPGEWTLVSFEKTVSNDRSMARNLSLIVPPTTAEFLWARNLRWSAIDIPDGDVRPRQIMSRFVRDPAGIHDDTGADDRTATPGRSWQTVAWPFVGQAGMPVGLEVWHDHHLPWGLEHAQFAATTPDY
ncbi:hypothetical protein ACIOKD_14175 [Streptomyces sp. NPDC087844]|uniref:hypothetical protein n=1 Tax=Streptomyces sp. NPDC087844 TaxID=3365805 RepID=UPI0038260071